MRHTGIAAEDVTNAVARAVGNTGRVGYLREPRRKLAAQAWFEVGRACLDGRQILRQHAHGLQRKAVGQRMRTDRAPALYCVIHCPHAG